MMEISKRKKIIISTVFILIFIAVVHVSAESIWEGSAAMGRYGEFPFTGFYGASNSFPQNAFVEVENLENGKRSRVIIVDRLSDSGLLMLVSNEAAEELGIYQNDIARIKVRLLKTASSTALPKIDDSAYNPDPDLNPAAALMTREELVLQDVSDVKTADEPEAESPADIVEAVPVEEEISEPLYLTMEDVEEVTPPPEVESPAVEMPVPEADEIVLLEEPEEPEVLPATLELLSSGLGTAEPAPSGEDYFSISSLPEISDKTLNKDGEYLTEASNYYKPVIKEAGISVMKLPSPEPEIPEEVIAVLVGDHLLISETEPENVEFGDVFYDAPDIVYTDDSSASVLAMDLMDAEPIDYDSTSLIAEAFPSLPGSDDSTLVEVANGYISPDIAEYAGEIKDYPDYAGDPEPAEVTSDEDALVNSDAPVSDEPSTIPEYDENVEVSLVPAEVRPPELVEDEAVISKSEPVIVKPVEPVVTAAEVLPVEPELMVPVEVVMVSKLQQQRHYLQLGAFKEKNSAIKAAGNLEAVYPVTILSDESTASYKLLLGPLSADESGIMLYNFRAGGYSDAFIRRIE